MRKKLQQQPTQHFGISHIFTVSICVYHLPTKSESPYYSLPGFSTHPSFAGHGILPHYLCPPVKVDFSFNVSVEITCLSWQGGGNHSTWPSKKLLTLSERKTWYTVTWLAAVDSYLPHFPFGILWMNTAPLS